MKLSERAQKKKDLETLHADLVGRPWPGRRYPGCYEVIQLYVKKELGRDLKNFSGLYTSFKDEAVAEENGLWISKPRWGEPLDFDVVRKNDLLLYKIYTDSLGGGYSTKMEERAPNHGAIYLGDGFILHQVWQEKSSIVDLMSKGAYLYQHSCVGIVRENAT